MEVESAWRGVDDKSKAIYGSADYRGTEGRGGWSEGEGTLPVPSNLERDLLPLEAPF
jgi:hypothetical protein